MIKIKEKIPDLYQYLQMRKDVGWGNGSEEHTTTSLRNSIYCVCLEENNELIGFGRIVGDGILNFYIQDIIVIKHKQGMGYGKLIMDKIMQYLKINAKDGSFIGLFSTNGVERFYEKYDFIKRPHGKFGAGMFQVVNWKIKS